MTMTSEYLYSLFLTFLADSVLAGLFFFLLWYLFISIIAGILGGKPTVPDRLITQIMKIGAAHGLTTCLLILYFNPQTPYAGAFVTFLATFIVSIPTVFSALSKDGSVPFSFSRLTVKNAIELVKVVAGTSLSLSVILAVPSFLLYFLTEKIRGLFLN